MTQKAEEIADFLWGNFVKSFEDGETRVYEFDITKAYRYKDPDGRIYRLDNLLNPNRNRPNLTYEFKGMTRVWRWTKERMLQEDARGRVIVPRDGRGVPAYKRYLDKQEGVPIDEVWVDIDYARDTERLGYPTQKPVVLLKRIIESCSDENDLVLDPFCGCGTAIVAAMGIFITLEHPTRDMIESAKTTDPFISNLKIEYPKIQIMTVAQLLNRESPRTPPTISPWEEAMPIKRLPQHRPSKLL